MSLSCFRSQNREAFLKYMKAEHVAWIKEHTAGTTNFVKLFTINNIKVSFFDTGKEAENQQLKFKAAQAAVTAVSARLALPPFVNVYATSDDISYGFVDRTSDEMQPATGHILLGKSVVTIRPQENDDTVTIASQPYKLRGGGTAGGRRLVADQIYDSASGGAAEKKQALVLTCCFHELGHVLHAYNSESAYYDGQDLKDKLFTKKDRDQYDIARTYVSEWSLYGASMVPSEFVAETFSGLMSGLAFRQTAIDHYMLLGGPGVSYTADVDSSNNLFSRFAA